MTDEIPDPVWAAVTEPELEAHEPYVVPYVDVTDRWVVRCGCGLMEVYHYKTDAQARADEHRAGPGR